MLCERCGQEHVATIGGRPCIRHAHVHDEQTDRIVGIRPCRNPAMNGQDVCYKHGGASPQARAAAAQRIAEEKAMDAVTRKLGDAGTPITDPIGTLCAIAGRAVRFMELIGEEVDQLEELRRTDRTGAEQIRAEIALYERSMRNAAQIVESIIRQGIAERIARDNADRTTAIVAFFDAVLTDLGHNPRDPEVAAVITRRLELVA